MNYKKKSLMISVILIISIQIVLLITNRQKSSFRYFIWNIDNVSIGRLICVSYISGLLMSFILNKTLKNDVGINSMNEVDEKTSTENDFSKKEEYNNDSFEMPPERDLRDIQPTISVNYRVVKDNAQNEIKVKKQESKNSQYIDDWNQSDSEW